MASPHYAPGRYVCRIIGQALTKAGTGTPQFMLRFTVLGTPNPQDPEAYLVDPNQYDRSYYRAITANTIDYLMDDLRAIGFTGDSFKFLDPSTPGFQDFKGVVLDMMCAHESSTKGGNQEKWSIARSADFTVTPLDPKGVRDLDNLFGQQLKKLNGGKPQPAVLPKGQADPPHAFAPRNNAAF